MHICVLGLFIFIKKIENNMKGQVKGPLNHVMCQYKL